jgi:hypothetical protein
MGAHSYAGRILAQLKTPPAVAEAHAAGSPTRAMQNGPWSHFFPRLQKHKFDPVWESHYLVYPGGLSLPRMLADMTALVAAGSRQGLFTGRAAQIADIRGALPFGYKGSTPRFPLDVFRWPFSARSHADAHAEGHTPDSRILKQGCERGALRGATLHARQFREDSQDVTGDARDGRVSQTTSGAMRRSLDEWTDGLR